MSVPIRHPSDKTSAVTSFEADIYLHRECNKIPDTYAVYSCVWRLGCSPGAWRRGSWHYLLYGGSVVQTRRGCYVPTAPQSLSTLASLGHIPILFVTTIRGEGGVFGKRWIPRQQIHHDECNGAAPGAQFQVASLRL